MGSWTVVFLAVKFDKKSQNVTVRGVTVRELLLGPKSLLLRRFFTKILNWDLLLLEKDFPKNIEVQKI